MKKLLTALAASTLLAAPAAAHDPAVDAEIEARVAASLPSGREIEAIAPVLDRSVDAMLELDVGPLLDAADPYARRPGYGRPGRTLRRMGRRNDPYFEARLRDSIYGSTAELGRMMDSIAVAAPAFTRSLLEMQRGIEAAVDDYHRRRGERYDPYHEDEGPYELYDD